MNDSNKPQPKPSTRKSLVATVGVAAAGILMGVAGQVGFTEKFEGMVLKGYRDPIGIPTKCAGDTYDVELGKRYTLEECKESLEKQLVNHAEPVLKCAPNLKNNPFFLSAAVDHNYHMGKFCGTTIDKTFKAGNYAEACKRFNTNADGTNAWIYVKDKKTFEDGKFVGYTYKTLPGLVKRAQARRELCEKGLGYVG